MFLLERSTAIANKNITVIFEFPVEDQHNKFVANPILIPHQIKLLILPLDQTAIIFPFLHIISFQFNQILDFLHGSLNIIRFRDVHAETK